MAIATPDIPVTVYYVRPDRANPIGLQLVLINEHGRTAEEQIWSEVDGPDSWQNAVNQCDTGEAIGVCGVHRIPGTVTDLVRIFDELRAEGKFVYDLERDTLIDPNSAAAVADAWRIKSHVNRLPTSEEAARRAALSTRSGWRKMTKDQRAAAIKIFTDAETIGIGAELLGISRSTAHRWMNEGWLPPHPTTIDRNKR